MRRAAIARRGPLGVIDAVILATLAYAGLRPQELLALDWDDVLTDLAKLFVARKNVDGEVFPYLKSGRRHRNRRHRRVDLFAPLAADLRAHRMRSRRAPGLVIARPDGAPWRKHDWDNWRKRVWQPLAVEAGLGVLVDQGRGRPARYEGAAPYELRGSFVSLLVWEGRTMLEVAAQAGPRRRRVRDVLRPDLRGLRPRAAHERRGGDPGRPPNRRTPDGRYPRREPGRRAGLAPLNPCTGPEADGGTRTPDPIITSDVLYQLSYVGECAWCRRWTSRPQAPEDGSDGDVTTGV